MAVETATTGCTEAWHALDGDEAWPNRIAPERREAAAAVLWRQLTSPLVVVLIAAGLVALALGELAVG